MLGIPAASRKTSGPALHEARTLLGAGTGASRIRIRVKPVRGVPPKGDIPHRQPLDLAEVLAKLAAVLDKPRSSHSVEEEFGVDPGVATTETEYIEALIGGGFGGGHARVQRILSTRHENPGVIIAAHETRVREDLMTLCKESWSWQRHAKEHLLHHCGQFRTLRTVIVMVAGALDEGRIGGFERQHAMLCQIYRILESGAKDSGHDLVWGLAAARTVRP